MKPKNNSEVARRNRNNRMRGSNMEKKTADYLEMDVVPYSGSNGRFGYGDIRDSIWLGECKNITPDCGFIVLKREWLDKNRVRAKQANRMSFLAFMESGRSDKYIALENDEWNTLLSQVSYNVTVVTYKLPKLNKNVINYRIFMGGPIIKCLTISNGVSKVILEGEDRAIYVMNIALFKMLVIMAGLNGNKEWRPT